MEFEQIYTTYFRDVFLYVRRLSGSEHVAEEITSETFFRALRTIDKFRGDCDMRVWLCQIAKNCYYTYLEKNRRTESLEAASAEHAPSFEQILSRREQVAQIQRILHTIPEPYREVFMWRVYAELSFRQIGQIFGKSENWACVTYHRAKSKIKERLESECNDK
jgi:RNA polymerase sigma-70 factor (ECF subfamily)